MFRQFLAALAMTVGLLAVSAPTYSVAQSDRLIPLKNGLTCWTETSRRCFRYGAGNRRATRSGFGTVYVPPELEVKPGYISEAGFIKIERAISRQVGDFR